MTYRKSSTARFVLPALVAATALLLGGPLGSPGFAAAAKKPATKAKVKSKPKTTLDPKAKAKKPAGKGVDTSGGRDQFCTTMLGVRQALINNLAAGSEKSTLAEIQKAISLANGTTMAVATSKAHLPMLRWAMQEATDAYFRLAAAAITVDGENPKEVLDAELKLIAEDLDPFYVLHGYTMTRCNFSMFVYDTDNLDAGPSDDIPAFGQSAIEDAKKIFPPAPPASATWPRKNTYSTAGATPVPTTTA